MSERRSDHEDFMKERRTGQDRREHARHPVAITMELTAGNDLYFHVSGNLSRGGAFFNRAIPHPIGTRVQLTFQLPGDDVTPVRCEGEVVNVPEGSEGLGMGVRFLDLPDDEQQRVERFLERVGALHAEDAGSDEGQSAAG
jgi:uncharacterized protein (TIGR02266 family)